MSKLVKVASIDIIQTTMFIKLIQ